MAEHGLAGPVLGFAWDGTGYGTDGTLWGGELLVARLDGFDRVGSFRPLALPGGETAIREPWRMRSRSSTDAFPEGVPLEVLALFDDVDPRAADVVRQMIQQGLQTPRARGVGRFFDAFGSLFLRRPYSRYEGQIATAWNIVADPAERGSYPFSIAGEDLPEIDLRLDRAGGAGGLRRRRLAAPRSPAGFTRRSRAPRRPSRTPPRCGHPELQAFPSS